MSVKKTAQLDLPSELHELAAKLFLQASCSTHEVEFLHASLPLLAAMLGSEFTAVARCEPAQVVLFGSTGVKRNVPPDLLADALDGEAAMARDGWLAAELDPRSRRNELLVAFAPRQRLAAARLANMAGILHASLEVVRDRERQHRRVQRLEAILLIAGRWNQTLEMDTLLAEMAQASTRLLNAERASIFLWDRPRRTLVGHPALGVEGGELRIPDHTGIVGKVVHSGQPLRVNERDGQDQIDRQVDRQLQFHTRSLLCVPLRGKGGELFGAFELVNKTAGDFTEEDEAALLELANHAAIALENTQQHEQLLKERNQIVDQAAQGLRLIGQCPAIEKLRETIRRVANTDLAVLLLGENGTGKEVVSQCIHYTSRRRHQPFVAVNCAALSETLLQSELFGHEKGAFTDARAMRAGKFELASGGTLFLDEIGDMSPGGQSKLLRVLEEKVVVRVGGSTPIHTDTRVIAATNQNLAELVRSKRFREDLYYRLNVVTLELPSLRERGEDTLLLAEHFLQEFSARARRRPPKFTAAARKRLLGHAWPGNIRELRNLVERLVYLSTSDPIDGDELSFILSPRNEEPPVFASDLPLAEATRRFQCEFIRKQISRTTNNMSEAAARLGLHRSNLYRKMCQLGMETKEP